MRGRDPLDRQEGQSQGDAQDPRIRGLAGARRHARAQGRVISARARSHTARFACAFCAQPLRTARITQEAAVRKVDKATKKAAMAAEKSELAAKAAAAEAAHAAHAEEESRAAKILADAAVEAADAALTRANAELDKVVERVNAGGDDAVAGQEGSFWWMDRQFEDAKKYMSKKQIAKVEAQMAARNQKRESSRKL